MVDFLDAFQVDEDAIVLNHADGDARSVFRVCRVCGCLVMDSMVSVHFVEYHLGK